MRSIPIAHSQLRCCHRGINSDVLGTRQRAYKRQKFSERIVACGEQDIANDNGASVYQWISWPATFYLQQPEGVEGRARGFNADSLQAYQVEVALVRKTPAPKLADVKSPPRTGNPERRRFSVSAGVGTNALHVGDTGTPSLGVEFAVTGRLSIGAEVLFTALSAIPELRYRLLGDRFSVHAVVAAPVNLQDNGESSIFAAGAGGLGVRFRATDAIAVRLESWVAYAGKQHGTTVPSFAAAEVFF